MNLETANVILKENDVTLYSDKNIWSLGWSHGTTSIWQGKESEARLAAAIFVTLFSKGVDVEFARNLAYAYVNEWPEGA